MSKRDDIHSELTSFLGELTQRKEAGAAKRADERAPTSHASGSGDNGTQTSNEGRFAAGQSKDTKEIVGPASVESGGKPPEQSSVQPNIGVQQADVGGTPSVETSSVASGPPDRPGTDHAATTEDGKKYAAVIADAAKASYSDLRKAATFFGNRILAKAAAHCSTPTASPPAAIAKPSALTPPVTSTEKTASATPAATAPAKQISKEAADQFLNQITEPLIHEAMQSGGRMADLYVNCVTGYMKRASEEGEETESAPPKPSEESPESGGGGSPPPSGAPPMEGGGGGGGMGGGPSEEEAVAELLQVLQERGISPEQFLAMVQGLPGGDMGGGMGGPPPMGGDPSMGGGAPPMGGGAPPPMPMEGGGGPMPPPPGPGMEIAAAQAQQKSRLVKAAGEVVKLSKKKPDYMPSKSAREGNIRMQLHRMMDDIFGRA